MRATVPARFGCAGRACSPSADSIGNLFLVCIHLNPQKSAAGYERAPTHVGTPRSSFSFCESTWIRWRKIAKRVAPTSIATSSSASPTRGDPRCVASVVACAGRFDCAKALASQSQRCYLQSGSSGKKTKTVSWARAATRAFRFFGSSPITRSPPGRDPSPR